MQCYLHTHVTFWGCVDAVPACNAQESLPSLKVALDYLEEKVSCFLKWKCRSA